MTPLTLHAPEIPGVLSGRVTRIFRVLKDQPWRDFHLEGGCQEADWAFFAEQVLDDEGRLSWALRANSAFHPDRIYPLPLSPGEYWVRETWSGEHCFHSIKPSERPDALDLGEGAFSFRESIWYWADGDPDFGDWERPRSPVTMPRWASRASIRVTDVRVHRVQDIHSTECMRAGIDGDPEILRSIPVSASEKSLRDEYHRAHVQPFAALFNAINGPSAWEKNPWVCGAEIRRIEP